MAGRTNFVDGNEFAGNQGTMVTAAHLSGWNNPKFSSQDLDGHADAGWEDPRAYGDGSRTGTNIALACVAAANNGGKVRLAGGTYAISTAALDFLNVEIDPMPGSYMIINAGCSPVNLRIFGTPRHKVIECAPADTPVLTYVNPVMFGAVGDGVADDTDAVAQTWYCGFSITAHIDCDLLGKVYLLSGAPPSGSDYLFTTADYINAKNGRILFDTTSSAVIFIGIGKHCSFECVEFDAQMQNRGIRPDEYSRFTKCEFLNTSKGTASAGGEVIIPQSHCSFEYCHFTTNTYNNHPENASHFAIRPFSDFTQHLPEDSCNSVENVRIIGCKFDGAYAWNVIELCGPGCRNCIVSGCYFDGSALTAIECDKGASYNIIENNTIVGISVGVISGGVETVPMRSQGYNDGYGGNPYIAKGNIFRNNKVLKSNNMSALFSLTYSSDTLIDGNFFDDSRGGDLIHPIGLYDRVTIKNNTFKSVSHVALNGSNVLIDGNSIKLIAYRGIEVTSALAGYIKITNNIIECDNTYYTIGATSSAEKAAIDITVSGNRISFIGSGSATAIKLPKCGLIKIDKNIFVSYAKVFEKMTSNVIVEIGNNSLLNCSILVYPTVETELLRGKICENFDVTNTSSIIRPSVPEVTYSIAPPATGAWHFGAIVYNVLPSAGEYLGWICTLSGTPGTWKPFGLIDAVSITYLDSVPTNGVWVKGDRVYNTNPAPGGNIGWVCTTSGDFGVTPPVFKTFGVVDL